MNIVINNLRFKDKDFSSIKSKNYEYTITSNEIMLFGYGQNNQGDYLEKEITIEKFAESFRIDFLGNTKISKKEIIRQGLILNINFTTIDNINITTRIELKISNYKKFKI